MSFVRTTFAQYRLFAASFAALTGILFSGLGFIYTIDSLYKTFLVTSCTFALMSIYGYTTKRDLTSLGSFCVMAIWGLFIAGIVNAFFRSPVVDFVASFVGVIAFTLFIAYDTQKIKDLYYELDGTPLAEKAALMGAFSLYITFINLFMELLRFLARKKERQ